MNVEAINRNRAIYFRNKERDECSQVADFANQIQRQTPGITRTEALRIAERIVQENKQ